MYQYYKTIPNNGSVKSSSANIREVILSAVGAFSKIFNYCSRRRLNRTSRKFDYIIARSYGKVEERYKFSILEYVDKPSIETDDVFYIRPEDYNRYLARARFSGGSALVFIGSFEIGEDQNFIINECKLIYCHSVGFREYLTDAACLYNIKSYYEALRAQKAREEEAQRLAALEQQRQQERLQAALRKIEEEEARQQEIEAAKRTLSDETAGTEERLNAAKLLEKVR